MVSCLNTPLGNSSKSNVEKEMWWDKKDNNKVVDRWWEQPGFGARSFKPLPACHEGNTQLCSGPDVYLGGNNAGAKPSEWIRTHENGVLIDLADVMDCEVSSTYGFKLPNFANVIQINWRDYSVPKSLTLDDWKAIVEEIRERKEALVFCMGGHGRTGTLGAILAILFQLCKPEEGIAYVRKHYCKSAVESMEQVKYIESLFGKQTDREVKSFTSFLPNYRGVHGYGNFPSYGQGKGGIIKQGPSKGNSKITPYQGYLAQEGESENELDQRLNAGNGYNGGRSPAEQAELEEWNREFESQPLIDQHEGDYNGYVR